jgi:hypothetical protein
VQFPSRGAPAATTVESDEALLEKGYVSLGTLEAAVEKERCQGTADAPAGCRPVEPDAQSTARLLLKAGQRGGDLVRIVQQQQPRTIPWDSAGCRSWQNGLTPADFAPPAPCAPGPRSLGTRHLLVSSGVVWRREPALVPTMRLAQAVEAGDEARVAEALPHVAKVDVYLGEAPLVIAARNGHAGIVRRLLAAGARAHKDQALLAAVGRSDLVITEVLLAAGASPEALSPETRERPLHVAAVRKASPEVVERLLAAGATIDALDGSDHMPLQSALMACNSRTAQLLLDRGAETNWVLADVDALAIARDRCPDQVAPLVQRMMSTTKR